jgi:hypothetical protein
MYGMIPTSTEEQPLPHVANGLELHVPCVSPMGAAHGLGVVPMGVAYGLAMESIAELNGSIFNPPCCCCCPCCGCPCSS